MKKAKAIVYESETGFTKKYAELLSQELQIPAYERKLAEGFLGNGDDIIYMGWLCANAIVGYGKASKLYNAEAACGVGMAAPSIKMQNDLEKKYPDVKVFYLHGGYAVEKLKGFNKLFMKVFSKITCKSLSKKQDKTKEDIMMMELMRNGGDYVKVENLEPIISCFK
jgi:hypothetical protein